MSVPIQPLADYVVAVAEEATGKTNSGLYIPSAAQEKPKVAKILAVGKDVKNVKNGDKIIYKDGYGDTTVVKLDADEYILVKEENILATVK